MTSKDAGGHVVRLSRDPGDIVKAQRFRARCFGLFETRDADAFDARCIHALIEERSTGALLGCLRLQTLSANHLNDAYAAQFYNLDPLKERSGPHLEIGRFCIAPSLRSGDIARLALGLITRLALQQKAEVLFGSVSFAGTDPTRYRHAFSHLHAHHLTRPEMAPTRRHAKPIFLKQHILSRYDPDQALREIPALLRSYLKLGASVSDHVMIDPRLKTLHVFCALELATVPETQRRRMTSLAARVPLDPLPVAKDD